MTLPSLNCLAGGETLAEFVKTYSICGIDVAYCRFDKGEYEDDTCVESCPPQGADFATIYGRSDRGEAVAIHDVDLTEDGAAEVGVICAEVFRLINAGRGAKT